MWTVEEALIRLRYVIDENAHITVNNTVCLDCDHQSCVYCCPAGCFSQAQEAIVFQYHGCLECGACRIVCDRQAVTWNYPRGDYGVSFCHG